MNVFVDAIAWILDPAQYTASNSVPFLIGQQLFYTFVSVLIAALIAVPIGWAIGHTGKGREFAVAVSGAARAIPSFGLLSLLILLLGVTQKTEAAPPSSASGMSSTTNARLPVSPRDVSSR